MKIKLLLNWRNKTMLSDEEKKAIDKLKRSANYFVMPIYETKIILELIEKQSKEIEEYKKQLDLDYVDKHFVPVERYNQLEKEIEELKNKNKKLKDKAKELIFEKQELTSALLDSTPNDKIKAKIEECEKEKNIPHEMDFKAFYRIKDLKNIEIKVLQSLLDKE